MLTPHFTNIGASETLLIEPKLHGRYCYRCSLSWWYWYCPPSKAMYHFKPSSGRHVRDMLRRFQCRTERLSSTSCTTVVGGRRCCCRERFYWVISSIYGMIGVWAYLPLTTYWCSIRNAEIKHAKGTSQCRLSWNTSHQGRNANGPPGSDESHLLSLGVPNKWRVSCSFFMPVLLPSYKTKFSEL